MVLLTVLTGVYAYCVFRYSHEYSKIKYDYGKNERNIYENVRRTAVHKKFTRTKRTFRDRHIVSKLYEEKASIPFNN